MPLTAAVQAESERRNPVGTGNLGFDQGRLQAGGDGPKLRIVAERFLDQRIQLRILKLFPPMDIDRSLRRRSRIPRLWNRQARLPFGWDRGPDASGSRKEHGQKKKVRGSHP